MAAKCNITGKILAKLRSVQYGLKYVEDLAIPENYVEYLDCPTVQPVICNPSPCNEDGSSGTDVINCVFTVGRIKKIANEAGVDLTFTIDDIYKVAGYTYLWAFVTTYFEEVGDKVSDVLKLNLKAGVDPDVLTNIVLYVRITVTNNEGCDSTKECYFNSGGDGAMNCVPFTPCYNTNDLAVGMIGTPCPAGVGLLVVQQNNL